MISRSTIFLIFLFNLPSCGGGGGGSENVLGEEDGGGSLSPLCDRSYYRQMLGRYAGSLQVLSWEGSGREVIENSCTWDVNLEVNESDQSGLGGVACSMKVVYLAELVAHNNYSSSEEFSCLRIKSTFNILDTHFLDPMFLDNPPWPIEFVLDGGTQPIPSSQSGDVQIVTPLGENPGSGSAVRNIKKEDGNIVFMEKHENISIEGTLSKQ